MKKDNRSVIQTLTLIFQFGISMLVPIFLCSILGVWLGNLTGINWLMIPFFFMGALAGFTKRKKTMLKRINEALPGLVVSILLYGVIVELIGVWFVKDRIAYSIGVWFGIAIAVGMAINLATVIFDSVTMGDTAHATRRIVTKSILRYVVVVILFVLFGYFQWGNLIAAFLGLLGLKIGAYLQPLWEKVKGRR